MQYKELNLFNTSYRIPVDDKVPPELCPRDEIVDPAHVKMVMEDEHGQWHLCELGGSPFYAKYLQHDEQRCAGLQIDGFYVVTEHPTMFSSLNTCVQTKAHLYEWLAYWWNKAVLFTVPLYIVPETGEMCFVANTYPLHKIHVISASSPDILIDIVHFHGYTMANGLSLFVAMARLGKVDKHDAASIITMLKNALGGFYQAVTEPWHTIYYSHVVMHVADNPWLYAHMGKNIAPACVRDALVETDEDEDGEFISSIVFSNKVYYETVRTVMLPNVRCDLIKRYDTPWHKCPYDTEEGDSCFPDVSGIIIGATRTRKATKWFIESMPSLVQELKENTKQSENKILEKLYTTLCHLYNTASTFQPRLCYSRIRQIWQHVFTEYDPDGVCINTLLNRWMLRHVLATYMFHRGYIEHMLYCIDPPFAFLKDVFEAYSDSINIFKHVSHRVICDHKEAIADWLTNSNIKDHQGEPVLIVSKTMQQLFQMCYPDTHFYEFYKVYLHRRIYSRFQAIYQGFGMLTNKDSTKWPYVPAIHTVGMLMHDYVTRHPELLYA